VDEIAADGDVAARDCAVATAPRKVLAVASIIATLRA
jgi:hypothetical protein